MLICDTYNLIGILPFQRPIEVPAPKFDTRQRKNSIQNMLERCNSLSEHNTTQDDANVIIEGEEELYRMGKYTRIFPSKENIDYYLKFFDNVRYNTLLTALYTKSGSIKDTKKYYRKIKNPVKV